jgi:ethanolamine kinase
MPLPHSDETLAADDEQAAVALCCRLLPQWSSLRAADVKLSVISGGITNSLVKLVPPLPLQPVVLRVFGANTDIIIERQRELRVLLQLNAAGFGAPVLLTFTNGRVEAWLPARPLEPAELSDETLSPRIAQLLAAFHAAAVDEPREPRLWPLVRGWLRTALTLVLPDAAKQARFASIDISRLEAEVEEVQAACDSLRSPTVFCHNDVLAGNVLLEEGEPARLHLIDFEYGCYSPRGFDVANHWNEWAGFDCAYERYPTEAQQRRFASSYLAAATSGPVDEAAVDALVLEADVYSLASHLYWSSWCLIQACHSAIEFDYLEYHGLRMAEYWRRKDGVLARLRVRPGI